MPRRLTLSLVPVCLCTFLVLAGCGDASELDVAAGRYRLQVDGAVTDTLAGPALLRSARPPRMGLELGPRDGPGLSMQLAPAPADTVSGASLGRYEVVQAFLPDDAPPDSLSRVIAFLSLADANFIAAQGHLAVTHADDGAVRGTFDFEMTEQGRSDPRTIRVTGALRATAP
ncbi:MAG: hypothetical protein V5A20_09365 [Salinibacter sp.]|jgi:hypothetical protein|uniref:hypothetical protein n=1 Tax=Salinibacter sp. TaxID=2065818 RepID=UPI002FC3BFD7